MGIADLTSPRAKLGRADEHLNVFNSEFRVFSLSSLHDPKPVNVEFRYEDGWYVAYMYGVAPLPARMALIAGDCLNNFRAVLDHVVWQLVLREDHKPRYTHGFPLYEFRQKFLDDVKSPPKKKQERSPLWGIPVNGDAWAIIEGAQPFCRPKPQNDELLLLAQLTNIDKHRTLLVQQSFPDLAAIMRSVRWDANFQPIERQSLLFMDSLKYPAKIMRFRFPPGVDPGMHMEGKFRMFPTLGDGQTQASFDLLGGVRKRVQEILDQLAALPRVQG